MTINSLEPHSVPTHFLKTSLVCKEMSPAPIVLHKSHLPQINLVETSLRSEPRNISLVILDKLLFGFTTTKVLEESMKQCKLGCIRKVAICTLKTSFWKLWQTDIHTYRNTNRHTYIHTDRQIDRHTGPTYQVSSPETKKCNKVHQSIFIVINLFLSNSNCGDRSSILFCKVKFLLAAKLIICITIN